MRDKETQPLSIVDTTESPEYAKPLDLFANERRRLEVVPLVRQPEPEPPLPSVAVDVAVRRLPRPSEIAAAAAAGVVAAICLYTIVVGRGGNATPTEAPAVKVAAAVNSAASLPIIKDPAWDVPPPVPLPEEVETRVATANVAPAPARSVNIPLTQGPSKPVPAPRDARERNAGRREPENIRAAVVDSAPSIAAPVPTATTGVAPAAPPEDPIVASVASAAPPARPPAAVVLPARSAVAPATPTPAAATPVILPRAAVLSVLDRYANAFSLLDARRAKAVWPSVNERNLEKAFDTLERQEFDLGACEITVEAPRALAYCSGTANYTPKVGNRKPRSESRLWTFRLQQNGDTWSIESVDSR